MRKQGTLHLGADPAVTVRNANQTTIPKEQDIEEKEEIINRLKGENGEAGKQMEILKKKLRKRKTQEELSMRNIIVTRQKIKKMKGKTAN